MEVSRTTVPGCRRPDFELDEASRRHDGEEDK